MNLQVSVVRGLALPLPRLALTSLFASLDCLALVAVLGFRKNFWFVVAALIGHGVFDFVHRFFIDNPGVPHWWSGFCLAFDALLGVFLAVRLIRHPERVSFEGR